MRVALRVTGLALLLIATLFAALLLTFTGAFVPAADRRLQPLLMGLWFRLLARIFGLAIRTEGRPLPGPALLACNHQSWLDIVVLGATLAGRFVSKAEISRWPMLGYFARYGGRTLFINRGEMRSFHALGGELLGCLRRGDRVIFFPEGTVSAGRGLLRFKSRLFGAAAAVGCPVQPVALAYDGGDGAPRAPMMDGDLFVIHALRMLRCRRTEVRVQFLFPLAAAEGDAKRLADASRARIAAALSAAADQVGRSADAAAA